MAYTGLRNAGKTTLLESLTRELVGDGYKVATVKYATVNISIDKKHASWNEDKIVSFKPVDTGLTH